MEIQIDTRACGDPMECRLCLDRCPDKVFGIYPQRPRRADAHAGDWVIFAMFASQCSGCMECVSFCPKQAISVRVSGRAAVQPGGVPKRDGAS